MCGIEEEFHQGGSDILPHLYYTKVLIMPKSAIYISTVTHIGRMVTASFASVTLLIGHTDLALSAVFEELDNGTLVQIDGGASTDAPPAHAWEAKPSPSGADAIGENNITEFLPAVLAGYSGKEDDSPARPTGAVLFDMAAPHPPLPTRMAAHGNHLPAPRQLGTRLSEEQRQMRMLAAEIATKFAHHPGVVRARLDEPSFVNLFTAMINRESNFNRAAVSPAGASGLGQLMPATARELGVRDVFSPQDNLHGAALYLALMLDQFGSPELALAAYNAGPGAVRRYRGIPPYPETRQYVADIVQAVAQTPDLRRQILEADVPAYMGDITGGENASRL
jgi:transglycosylase-like protein with SLT domain